MHVLTCDVFLPVWGKDYRPAALNHAHDRVPEEPARARIHPCGWLILAHGEKNASTNAYLSLR